ncbi:MAG TPA: APC family permease [Vicinamibacteria bacterium]|nr:APC family permease [Vicinamibacteria bacterium]
MTTVAEVERPELVRAIGRWSLAALVLNGSLGSAVFGYPSVLAGLLGPVSPWAYVAGAAINLVIVACFAEVASRFTEAGGAYLYARTAFGRFVGIQTAWLSWLVRLSAAAANANLFTQYLAEFFPAANRGRVRVALLSVFLGVLAAVNYRGVRSAARLSNFFTGAKLVPLLVFIGAGAAWLALHPGAATWPPPQAVSTASWLQALLLMTFAYGGFDGALMPMGEAKTPRRDAPFAVLTGLAVLTVLYTSVQLVTLAVLPDAAGSERPLAAAARVFLGTGGAVLMTLGAMLSVYGYLSANILNSPRLTFALAQKGDFPPLFGRVHERFHTPHVSIIVFTAAIWLLAVIGDFRWNATLSAVARLFTYGLTCAALIVLRRRDPGGAALRLPFGNAVAVLGILITLALVTRMGRMELYFVLGSALVAAATWARARARPTPA